MGFVIPINAHQPDGRSIDSACKPEQNKRFRLPVQMAHSLDIQTLSLIVAGVN